MIPTMINAALPVIIEVAEHTGFNRYNLRFGKKTLSTRSYTTLEVGEEYYANIGTQSGGVIGINTLTPRPKGAYLQGGASLLEELLANGDANEFRAKIKAALADTKDANEFRAYSQMLLALGEGVISVPFFYENRYALAQFKFENALKGEFYLLLGSFAPLLARFEDGAITRVATPYESFSKPLGEALGCEWAVAKIAPLWSEKKNFLDFEG